MGRRQLAARRGLALGIRRRLRPLRLARRPALAYGLANILAAIPLTPAGLGVVELVLVSMITGFGPTAGQALSACSPTGP